MLTVTAAAGDRALLTLAELRAAAGVEGGASDAALTALGARVAAAIAAACRVARAGAVPPTLRAEGLSEAFRLLWPHDSLVLARRPVAAIASVTENGTALAAEEFELDAAAGVLWRLAGEDRCAWPCGRVTVAYTAGWADVPADLKLAAEKFVAAEWPAAGGGRDPNLRRESINGVIDREWWVDPQTDTGVPAEVLDLLEAGGYVEHWIG